MIFYMILDDVSLVSYDFTCFLLYMMLDDFICFFCDFIVHYFLHCCSMISIVFFYEFTEFLWCFMNHRLIT